MNNNISKYIQINDFLLLEYQFNNRGDVSTLYSPVVAIIENSGNHKKYFYEGINSIGNSNNALPMNSIPLNPERSSWYFDAVNFNDTYSSVIDSSIACNTTSYPLDTIRIHVISGYNFEDVNDGTGNGGGFMIQVNALNKENSFVDLANFTYVKQHQAIENSLLKFSSDALFLGNRFYDKYIEFKIPSVTSLNGKGEPSDEHIEQLLDVKLLSDVYITYSTIFDILDNEFVLDDEIKVQLPLESLADKFNCFIAESQDGDYIEYYATWLGHIIGNNMNSIESGIIPLHTSNNPNDNYQEFEETYGANTRKWVLIHEISVYENLPGSNVLAQRYSFVQDANFGLPNVFRPVLKNSDIAVSYSIEYTCRLMNRMDGTQIIRKASFASTDPKKYGYQLDRLKVNNLLTYKVYNKIESERANILGNTSLTKTKYVKVFFDTVGVVLNAYNEVYPEGTGPLFLKAYDSVYKFKFEKIDDFGEKHNVDLSGAFNYALRFNLDDNSKIEVGPTYSTNMNSAIGEIEFALTEDQIDTLKKQQKNREYSVIVKNPNGTSYTFYQGFYHDAKDQRQIVENYQNMIAKPQTVARDTNMPSKSIDPGNLSFK